MTKLRLITALCVVLISSSNLFADELVDGPRDLKLTYGGPANKRALRFETPDGAVKGQVNLRLQNRFIYFDATNSGGNSLSSFELSRIRIDAQADVLNGQFTFRFNEALHQPVGPIVRAELVDQAQDMWMQYNYDPKLKLRFGQWKASNSRQWAASIFHQQFVHRAVSTNYFLLGRQAGLSLVGDIVPELNYHLSVFNGESAGEGINKSGIDSELMFVGGVSLAPLGEYDRSYEGDPYHSDELKLTFGVQGYVEQGNGPTRLTAQSSALKAEFTESGASIDTGLRFKGFSAQAEIMGANLRYDDGAEDSKHWGGYFQVGYFFIPQSWEVAGRYGILSPGSNTPTTRVIRDIEVEREYEYTLQLAHYIDGHWLKIQTGPTWLDIKSPSTGHAMDFRYDFQITANF